MPEFLANCKSLGPIDIGVVIAFGQILPTAVLSVPSSGCINVHGSLLPRWRGAAPIQRAIMAGDSETGVQLMQMEAGLDTGPVFATAKTAISSLDTAGSLHDRLADLGAELLVKNLISIAQGEVTSIAQQETAACYAAKILNTEAKIDWSKTAIEIERHIRGLTPYPGAYTTWAGKRLKILQSKISPNKHSGIKAAQVIITSNNMLEIICGQGSLLLELVQPEGKKAMPAADFIRGNPLPNSGCVDLN